MCINLFGTLCISSVTGIYKSGSQKARRHTPNFPLNINAASNRTIHNNVGLRSGTVLSEMGYFLAADAN
jgi:hypothetical protein